MICPCLLLSPFLLPVVIPQWGKNIFAAREAYERQLVAQARPIDEAHKAKALARTIALEKAGYTFPWYRWV